MLNLKILIYLYFFQVLIRDHSTEDAANMMNRMTKMCTRWLTDWGFSIGIEDVTPAPHLFRKKEALVSKGYEDARQQIAKYVRVRGLWCGGWCGALVWAGMG